MTSGHFGQYVPSDIVSRSNVLLARISESDDQLHGGVPKQSMSVVTRVNNAVRESICLDESRSDSLELKIASALRIVASTLLLFLLTNDLGFGARFGPFFRLFDNLDGLVALHHHGVARGNQLDPFWHLNVTGR